MALDFVQLCRDHGIHYADAGFKQCRPGWVQIACPFCASGPVGWHLGYNLSKYYFNCYRCGFHPEKEVLVKILGIPFHEIDHLLEAYSISYSKSRPRPGPAIKRPENCSLPAGTGEMSRAHREYLLSRKFDPEKLERLWLLKGTGNLAWPIGYAFRIIAPIHYNGKRVSYQGRDITNLAPDKYRACADELEVIPHKDIVYGFDQADGQSCVIVEGVTGVWRLGPGAVATFGIDFSQGQVSLLRHYKNRYIMYDGGERQAARQAEKLANALSAFPGNTDILELSSGDSGELPQKEADSLMTGLGFRR